MRRIGELDGLRAVAILLVLGCHYEGFSRLAWRIPQFGWIGVDLFFCLSGYLITSILLGLRGKAAPYKTFYSRRIIRIFPTYFAVIVLVAIVSATMHTLTVKWVCRQLLFLQAFHFGDLHAVWNVLTDLRWHLHHLPSLLSHAGNLSSEQSGAPLTILITPYILWSLSIEEYFYLLWAPIVLRSSRAAMLIIGLAICVIEVLLRWTNATPDAYFGIVYRLDALLYGAILAFFLDHWRRFETPRWAQVCFMAIFGGSAVGLAVVLFVIGPVLGRDPRSSPLMLVVGMPLLSIAFAALIGLLILRSDSTWWLSRLLRSPGFRFVGTISYTMYLVHLMAAAIIRVLFHVKDVYSQTFLQAVLSTLLTIGMAQLSWICLERKLLHWKDVRFPGVQRPLAPKLLGS